MLSAAVKYDILTVNINNIFSPSPDSGNWSFHVVM